MGQKLDYLSRFDPSLMTKLWGAAGAFFGLGGYAANSSGAPPLISEAVLFAAFGHGWTMAGVSLALGVTAGLIALVRVLIELARWIWSGVTAATRAASRWRQGRKPPPEGSA